MGKIFDKAQNENTNELSGRIISCLKESSSQSDEAFEEQLKQVLESFKVIENEESTGVIWDFSKEKMEEVFCFDNLLILKPITPTYYDDYLGTRDVYAVNRPSAYIDPVFKDIFINEITAEKSLFIAIIRKSDGLYLGYVGIKDTSKKIWEFCIELLPEYCNKGYGYKAVKSFLKVLSQITKDNKQQFRALVEVDNIASQKLMLKLGGRLIDIYDYTFLDEKRAEKFEEDHLNEITDHMFELADELMVEPRKLLSHVLDYRIFAEKL